MLHVLDKLQRMGAASLDVFWLPLAAWTVVAALLLVLLWLWPRIHPLAAYRAHLGLLLALPLGVAVAALLDAMPTQPIEDAVFVPVEPLFLVMLPPVPVEQAPVFGLYHALGVLLVIFGTFAFWRSGRLLVHALRLWRFRRRLPEDASSEVQGEVDRIAHALRIRRPVRVVLSQEDVVPLTFGWLRPRVVLSERVAADPEARRLVLAHELVHVRRHDYALHWVEQTLGALLFAHPLVTLLRRRLAVLREMACDAEVMLRESVAPKHYADLLFSLLPPASPSRGYAVGMADSRNLKRRLIAMKNYTPAPAPSLIAGLLALATLGSGAFAAANADALARPVAPPAPEFVAETADQLQRHQPSLPSVAPADTNVYVIVEQMPELIGGLAGIQKNLEYPESAKSAGIEGRVFIQFLVDEQGDVVDATVTRSLSEELDQTALEAVRSAKFTPGMQDGKPVRVKMSIPVIFRLAGDREGDAPAIEEAERRMRLQEERLGAARDREAAELERHVRERLDDLRQIRERLQEERLGSAVDREAAALEKVLRARLQQGEASAMQQEPEQSGSPSGFKIQGVYPNPFNPNGTIRFELPEAGDVRFEVFDMTGRVVESRTMNALPAGVHTARFEGEGLASGAYTYRLTTAGNGKSERLVGKFTLVK